MMAGRQGGGQGSDGQRCIYYANTWVYLCSLYIYMYIYRYDIRTHVCLSLLSVSLSLSRALSMEVASGRGFLDREGHAARHVVSPQVCSVCIDLLCRTKEAHTIGSVNAAAFTRAQALLSGLHGVRLAIAQSSKASID